MVFNPIYKIAWRQNLHTVGWLPWDCSLGCWHPFSEEWLWGQRVTARLQRLAPLGSSSCVTRGDWSEQHNFLFLREMCKDLKTFEKQISWSHSPLRAPTCQHYTSSRTGRGPGAALCPHAQAVAAVSPWLYSHVAQVRLVTCCLVVRTFGNFSA